MHESLQSLQVWDRLEVGPVALEPKRLRVPYRLGDEVQELAYRYAEAVFDPSNPADVNLASMIGAQVALNYGLFAKEIRFHGPFDAEDRSFLRGMAANTAREIYVNKLRFPNPFLQLPEVPQVPPGSRFAPKLSFVDPVPTSASAPWPTDPNRVLVLSSGGKDSLLSLGILEELGTEAHPIFVNESGRHWFTALNAWRHLEATREHAARVWTNCDRVFGWALRHLPFVREDFDRIRADIYPIRLWSVAVFLFGTLPLARKRGLGRLVVGDEYDTSVREKHEGITHYAGLYDQSRWFDEALSRYYQRKGWGVVQFSVLRTCSELLIEKTLVERYPKLQVTQISCHAAHVEQDRAYPCGRCEKCRRIVGMLVALDKAPERCGYTPQGVTDCLEKLAASGVKQIADDAAHLGWMLAHKGRIPPDSPFARQARRHSETMHLRFDSVGSPANTIPSDLRDGVHRILLEHAEGAVTRRGRSWVEMNPLSPDRRGPPHPHESPTNTDMEAIPSEQPTWWLGGLTWPQVRGRLREVDVALLPVGAVEQHGLHLPVDTDAFDAEYLANEVARACSDPKPLVLPTIPYGVSYHHEDFPGTFSVRPETLARLVHQVGLSAARNGIRKLVIVNAHGGNIPALHFAAQMINRDAQIFTCVDTGESSNHDIAWLVQTRGDVHAGEEETSTSLATRPELVRMEHARRDVPRFRNRYLDFGSRVGVEWYVRTSKISETGTLGDPTRASAEKGKRIWAVVIQNLVEIVEHLKATPLEQIHRPPGD